MKYNQEHYCQVFRDSKSITKLEDSLKSPSLLDLVQVSLMAWHPAKWLYNPPIAIANHDNLSNCQSDYYISEMKKLFNTTIMPISFEKRTHLNLNVFGGFSFREN